MVGCSYRFVNKVITEGPLWTVPACLGCNSGFKSDDEYTRTILPIDLRANWNFAAQVNIPVINRALARPEANVVASRLH